MGASLDGCNVYQRLQRKRALRPSSHMTGRLAFWPPLLTACQARPAVPWPARPFPLSLPGKLQPPSPFPESLLLEASLHAPSSQLSPLPHSFSSPVLSLGICTQKTGTWLTWPCFGPCPQWGLSRRCLVDFLPTYGWQHPRARLPEQPSPALSAPFQFCAFRPFAGGSRLA